MPANELKPDFYGGGFCRSFSILSRDSLIPSIDDSAAEPGENSSSSGVLSMVAEPENCDGEQRPGTRGESGGAGGFHEAIEILLSKRA